MASRLTWYSHKFPRADPEPSLERQLSFVRSPPFCFHSSHGCILRCRDVSKDLFLTRCSKSQPGTFSWEVMCLLAWFSFSVGSSFRTAVILRVHRAQRMRIVEHAKVRFILYENIVIVMGGKSHDTIEKHKLMHRKRPCGDAAASRCAFLPQFNAQ